MIHGLQAGFGDGIGALTLADIKARGFQMARIDCSRGLTPTLTMVLTQEVLDAGLKPLVIVDRPEQILFGGVDYEFRNEPDIEGPEPAAYLSEMMLMFEQAERVGATLWAGAISNLNDRGMDYLTVLSPRTWPEGLNVSVHRYPAASWSPWTAHRGFDERMDEIRALLTLIGHRRWGVSEFGYHTGVQWKWGFFPWRWDEYTVLHHVRTEWDFWWSAGAEFACLYQLNDGPTRTPVDSYGIRRKDGTWKPVADSLDLGGGQRDF